MPGRHEEWIYDWNGRDGFSGNPAKFPSRIQLNDETLRDGLQSPSAKDPPFQAKRDFLHLLVRLGIDSLNIGLPAAGPQAYEDTLFLAREVHRGGLPLAPNCAARTLERDIRPILKIAQKVGMPIEVAVFLGSSPVRHYAEGWDLPFLLKATRESVSLAAREKMPVMYVTEDTTRARPEILRDLYLAAIECGARRICVADTVGFATPGGAYRIVRFLRNLIEETGEPVQVDWHGHMDRGLGLISTLAALEAGADRLHGSALGVGERVGNAPMDLILVNLKLMGLWDRELTPLVDYVDWVARWVGISIPWNYPVFGRDAYRTGTGVHASALLKALNMGNKELVDLVYSSVPASWVGRQQTIEVGPMSGESNVVFWLHQHGVEPAPEKVTQICRAAKESDHMLSDDEIRDILQRMEES